MTETSQTTNEQQEYPADMFEEELNQLDVPSKETTFNEDEIKEVVEDTTNNDLSENNLLSSNSNVTMTYPAIEQMTQSEKDNSYTSISLPDRDANEMSDSEVIKRVLVQEEPTDVRDIIIARGVLNATRGELVAPLSNPKSDWRQTLEYEGVPFRAARPKYKLPSEATSISGDKAVFLVEQMFNKGGHIRIPLVHTGIWVSLRPFTIEEYISFRELLDNDKYEFAKQTLGAIFSNSRTYINNRIMELVEEHVTDISVKDIQPSDLRSIVKLNDLPVLAAAMGYTCYPNGVEYMSSCTADSKCNETFKARIKINNCIWYDRAQFTNSQLEFLSNRNKEYTLEEVKKYQLEIGKKNNTWDYKELRFVFHMPTVVDNVTSGYRWISDIETAINKVFDKDEVSRTNLGKYMAKCISHSMLRQYAHFIKTIVFVESGNYIEDQDAIEKILNRFSSDSEVLTGLLTAIDKYIDDNTHSIVAIPRYTCKACGKVQQDDIEKHPYLIPIDTINLFFAMGDQLTQYGSLN